MPGRMALLVTILLMLINISGRTHEKTPSSNTFSMIDLWILICIIFVTLALFEYGLVITIAYNLRGSTAQVHALDGGRNWTKGTQGLAHHTVDGQVVSRIDIRVRTRV